MEQHPFGRLVTNGQKGEKMREEEDKIVISLNYFIFFKDYHSPKHNKDHVRWLLGFGFETQNIRKLGRRPRGDAEGQVMELRWQVTHSSAEVVVATK